MGPSTPRLCSAPRTNVVLPAPSSPDTSTTSPGLSSAASRAPARSVSSGPEVSSVRLTEAQAQGGAGAEQQDAGQPGHPGVAPGVGQLGPRSRRGTGRGGRRGRSGGGRVGGWRGGRLRGGGRARPRRRSRGGLIGPERIRVLVVAGALGERLAGHGEGERGGRGRKSVAETHAPASVEASFDRLRSGAMGRHILLLTDRDWTHPQGGGTGANLYGQVAHWLQWGHRVTVVAGSYPGAAPVERPAPGLELHHTGTRTTVFPRAAWAVGRGLARDADVALEVVNGITFLTPLWLRRPRVALVHHIHRDHYVTELGRKGAAAALVCETLPLKLLYRGTPFVTVSEAARAELLELGVPPEDVRVVYNGVAPLRDTTARRSPAPRLLYLGRLKRYKRIGLLLDVVEALPGAVLDVAGEGDHRPALEAEIAARGLGERVLLHGHVDEAEKAALYARAWVNLTASS